jgi:glycosyltransferase involved in cell wall biosynthesis
MATMAETAPAAQPAETGSLELTILMPCLNEAETLAICIEKAQGFLARTGITGEVLIADNGSTDGSREIAANLGARVAPVADRGYGAALLGGIAAARGRYIIMGDADDSYDLANLDAFLERLRDGADLVIGNRFRGGIAPGAMPFLHRALGNPVLSWMGRLFFKIPTGDFHCGLRGFRAESIRRLSLVTSGMEFASEMVVRAAVEGLRLEEVPTTLKPDGRSRAPHLKTWRDGWRHFKFLLMYSPKWLFFFPGALLIAVGLLLATLLWLGPARLPGGAALDINTFTAACFMVIAGVQLASFGVLARYYASITGMLPQGRRSNWLRRTMNTDNVARIAGVLLVIGLATFGAAFGEWASRGFGDLSGPAAPRLTIAGLSIIVVAVQLGFQAFMIGILEIPLVRSGGLKAIEPD